VTEPRRAAVGALVLVLLAGALVWRLQTEATPPLAMQRTLAARVRIPGSAPVLAWPREGQAAVEVDGVGSFGASGDSRPVPIASVAKVMTAYLTLLEHPLAAGEQGFAMTITPTEVAERAQRVALGESTVAVRAGERLTERQALQALLLPSANNVAALLAIHDAGGPAVFVARMNSTARALGMTSTAYTDPSGFDQSTVSTAADQLKLARVAMRIPAFAEIVDEPAAVLPVAGRVANLDGLVGADGYVGVKTGSDGDAGGCLVFAKRVSLDGRRLTVLGVVLGQRQGALVEAALASAQRLGDSAAAALRVETVLPAGSGVIRASNVDGRRTTGATAAPLREIGWAGLALSVRMRMRKAVRKLSASELMATVSVEGASAAATGALAVRALSGPSLGWRLRHLL
jgi:D-alanyl-D-alanine carboxypeptidase (penicillin-binding protein 5/6)